MFAPGHPSFCFKLSPFPQSWLWMLVRRAAMLYSNPTQHKFLSGSASVQLVCRQNTGDDTPGLLSSQLQSALPAGLQCHLFFTNFFLEALGFKRLRPAPKVLSRTCRVAERLEMSFSAKGDTPAMYSGANTLVFCLALWESRSWGKR